jgi:uncharacterized membrane protein
MESHYRSLAKAFSYRIAGSTFTALVVYILTNQASVSLGAGALDMVGKIGLYFLHERIWDKISFGRSKPPEYEI